MQKLKKLFICQPIYGLTEEDVYDVRMTILDVMSGGEDIKDLFEPLYTYKYPEMTENNGYLWHIGRQIQDLEKADLVVFAPGWRNCKECLAVFDICNLYNVDYIDFAEEYL